MSELCAGSVAAGGYQAVDGLIALARIKLPKVCLASEELFTY